MKHFKFIFLLLIFTTTTHAATLVQGYEKDVPFSFTNPINTQAFNSITGTCIIGLAGTNNGNYAIACAQRMHKNEPPVFIPIAPKELVNTSIESLILTPNENALALIVPQTKESKGSNIFIALTLDGKKSVTSNPLTDTQGNITSGIISIATSETHVFSAIKSSTKNEDDSNNYIAITKINHSSQNTLELTTVSTHKIPCSHSLPNRVALHYDTHLNVLYCGLQTSVQNKSEAPYNSLYKAFFNPLTQELTFSKVGVNIADIHHLAGMHTKSKQNYLIINGGNNTLNELWALPRNKSNNKASISLIGNSSLPIAKDTPISHLEVIGDTVYVSIAHQQDEYNESGIFYSQALYNANGDIIHWTPWTKRAAPHNEVSLFSIDPVTGSLWITENKQYAATYITNWHQHNDLSRILDNDCYSAIDLDQATRGFLYNTANRYALFGGINNVLFARISHAHNKDSIISPQTVITDISNAENSLVTQLPTNSGAVTHLEYSKRDTGENNFFFAGTQKGLFVFAQPNGDGFPAHELTTLNTAPFTTSTWQEISQFNTPIIDLKCAGNALYVLTSQPSTTNPFKTLLYVVPFTPLEQEKPSFKNTTVSLFESHNIHLIAESGIGIFSDVTRFSAIGIISTSAEYSDYGDSAEKREQLVLATSNGLFVSKACQEAKDNYVLAGIADAQNQTEAGWTLLSSKNQSFSCINTCDTPITHILYPVSYNNAKKETLSMIHHVQGSEDPQTGPNTALIINTNNECLTLPGRVNYIWSDGGRSFYITTVIEQSTRKNKLITSASNTIEDEMDRQIRTYFWVKNIGATGLIMAGTDQGIIALG